MTSTRQLWFWKFFLGKYIPLNSVVPKIKLSLRMRTPAPIEAYIFGSDLFSVFKLKYDALVKTNGANLNNKTDQGLKKTDSPFMVRRESPNWLLFFNSRRPYSLSSRKGSFKKWLTCLAALALKKKHQWTYERVSTEIYGDPSNADQIKKAVSRARKAGKLPK